MPDRLLSAGYREEPGSKAAALPAGV